MLAQGAHNFLKSKQLTPANINYQAMYHVVRTPFSAGPFSMEGLLSPQRTSPPSLPDYDLHSHQHINETKGSVELSLDIPGVEGKDLNVAVEDGVLRVSGERKTAGKESKFGRSFTVDNTSVDISAIKANLDAGVLTLTVPKREKTAPQSIAITEEPTEHEDMHTEKDKTAEKQ
mmetsp:Transcript_2352/g.3695  ORF Transcript_2352/g.3695 Transcript_2352/m.3695 type:complete len:174 (+) Transcript_2352:176-697(+)